MAAHGACFAAGLEVALTGDIIVAAEGTLFGQPEVTRGLFGFGGGAIRWLQRTSWGNAQVHLLTGDTLTAGEAYRIGLVQEVVAPDALADRAFSKGRDLFPVLVTLMQWGDRWATDDGPPVRLVHEPCEQVTSPRLACEHCGGDVTSDTIRTEPS